MKKVLALVLVAVMALGMGVTAFAAATEYKYDNMGLGLGFSAWTNAKDDWTSKSTDTTALGTYDTSMEFNSEVRPHDEVEVHMALIHDMFQDGDLTNTNTPGANGARLSAADIRKSKIAVRIQVGGGTKVIKNYKIDAKKGEVLLEFVDEWVSTKEQDFEILVYLTINGRRMDEYGLTMIGTLENEIIPVYEDYDQVDLSVGYVAEAMDFVNNIEVDLGKGVLIYTKMFKGKKYYGTADREPDEAADIVMRQYPDIDNVVILKTVGLNSTGDVVKLDTDYSDYYVYDKELNYLGQSNEMLPYSSTYFLANKKLDIDEIDEDDDDGDEPEDDDDDATNPITGGNGSSSNANANPGTGR